MEISLGWRKDKYRQTDWIHKIGITTIPSSKNLSEYLPDVRHQGNLSSCVGFGIGANLSAISKKLGISSEWFSPTWIYNGARFIEGSLKEDSGAYPSDALSWLSKKGCLQEHHWPYNGDNLDMTSPPSSYNIYASEFPLLNYYRVTGGTTGISSAIAEGNFVSIGTPWFEEWMDIDESGNLPEPSLNSEIVGGHETCLYGYDNDLKIFYGINSWGTSWGKNGLFTMPFKAFNFFSNFGGYDAHYITVNWTKEPIKPTTKTLIKLEESNDNGNTWTKIFEGPLPYTIEINLNS